MTMATTSRHPPKFWTPGDWNAFFGFGTNILVNMLVLTGLLQREDGLEAEIIDDGAAGETARQDILFGELAAGHAGTADIRRDLEPRGSELVSRQRRGAMLLLGQLGAGVQIAVQLFQIGRTSGRAKP